MEEFIFRDKYEDYKYENCIGCWRVGCVDMDTHPMLTKQQSCENIGGEWVGDRLLA